MGRFTFRIWQVMLGGAVAVLISGEISVPESLSAINIDVMVFLFGMFVVGEAVYTCGYLSRVSDQVCRIARTKDHLLLIFIAVMAISSAVLMNDTVAIIGTPLALSLASRYRIPPVPILLTLCFALTTGSVPSPIGNPQNLLIATYWNPVDPFLTFVSGLLVPTVVGLFFVFIFMRVQCLKDENQVFPPVPLPDGSDLRLSRVTIFSLMVLAGLILIRIIGAPFGDIGQFPLGFIALVAALPILVMARQRISLIRGVDWRTLIFFASMFVLMQAVYNSGWFQYSVPFQSLTSVPLLLMLSIILSQFISNVPFIALFQPVISASGLSSAGMLALAAGSTIAGNLTILGAASNVIVVQQAEKAGIHISFRDFMRVGLPLTIIQGGVYALWLLILP